MYNYQNVQRTETFGGHRVVMTGIQYEMSSGRFTCSTDRFPKLTNGHIPAGVPIALDEVERTFDVHYAFKVNAAVTSTGTSIQIAKDSWSGSRIQEGMVLMIAPSGIDTTGTGLAVATVDRTNADYDVITVATGGFGEALSAGDTLVEASAVSTTATIKVKPNALQPYDLPIDPYSTIVWTDGLYNLMDGVILENRIPPIVDAVKDYMRSQDCDFRYSKSEE